MAARVVVESFESAVLAANPLGDPAARRFPVYLPPGYQDDPGRRYPAIYVLSGFSGTGLGLENVSGWGETLSQRLDRLIEGGQCDPVIVVSPDCFTKRGGSQYLNSSAVGRYEDYLVDELVPYIDRTYRTLDVAESRALMGKSSGGYGALVLSMRHPRLFGALACHSGDMGFDYCYFPDFPRVINALAEDRDPEAFLGRFLEKQKKPSKDFAVVNILCMAACYSPNPRSEWGYDLPFDLYDGSLKPDVWQRWLALDPVHMVEQHAEALGNASLVFIDCGTKDNFHLYLGARQLVRKLEALDIAHEYEEFPDDHFGLNYRFDVSIPKLVSALKGE